MELSNYRTKSKRGGGGGGGSEEVFEQILFCHLEEERASNKGKLIFYAKLKNKFGQENYLNLKNIHYRIDDENVYTQIIH